MSAPRPRTAHCNGTRARLLSTKAGDVQLRIPKLREAWTGLAAEASALEALLCDREPMVYRCYAHWWTTLPSAEVRLLAS
jgi:hypothetical protein